MQQDAFQHILDELRAMRCELVDLRALVLETQDQVSRCSTCRSGVENRLAFVEQGFSEIVNDQEKMIRSELMGLFAHFEGEFQARLGVWKKISGTASAP